jgi:RimJ/RimL family protein N-acetyltransferase
VTVELRDDGIVLRPLRIEDAPAHHAGEDEEQIRGFGFPGPAPLGTVIAAIERWQQAWQAGGPERNFGIWLPDGATLIGNVEIRQLEESGLVNLSYLVFPPWRRRGIATRAARLALHHAASVLGADRARIVVLETNVASINVARALGARRVGAQASESGAPMFVFEVTLSRDGP